MLLSKIVLVEATYSIAYCARNIFGLSSNFILKAVVKCEA
jgi:hypothetical protein